MNLLTPAVLGYLLGSIPFGLLVARLAGLGDIRQIGSGNIGATNVLRTGSKSAAALTLLLDLAKGFAAVVMASGWGESAALAPFLADPMTATVIAGIAQLIILRHHANIRRLLAGTESRISLTKS